MGLLDKLMGKSKTLDRIIDTAQLLWYNLGGFKGSAVAFQGVLYPSLALAALPSNTYSQSNNVNVTLITEDENGERMQFISGVATNPEHGHTWNFMTGSNGETNSDFVTAVQDNNIPTNYMLFQNFPNPFNPHTTIRYSLPKDGDVDIIIYNILGKKIKHLVDAYQNAGVHEAVWDATNDYKRHVVDGIYIYRIIADNYVSTKKMILLSGCKIVEGGYSGNIADKILRNSATIDGKPVDAVLSSNDSESNETTVWNVKVGNIPGYKDYDKDHIISEVRNDTIRVVLDLLNGRNINLSLQNTDTDKSESPGYAIINGDYFFSQDGELDIVVPQADEYSIEAGLFRKDGVTLGSFERSVIISDNGEPISDTLRIVDVYLRDLDGIIIDSLYVEGISPPEDSVKMSLERFKAFADYLHFSNWVNNVDGGGLTFEGVINGYAGNNGKLPEGVSIVDEMYDPFDGTTSNMEEVTKDRIYAIFENYINKIIGDREIPLIPKDYVEAGNHLIENYAMIIPDGNLQFSGAAAINGRSPDILYYSAALLRSGPPNGDPGDIGGFKAAYQEALCIVFGYKVNLSQVDQIVTKDESVIHDFSVPMTPTLIDNKLIRTTSEENYKRGENIDNILGL